MRLKQRYTNQESGFVSIFTVLFFVLLISIITVGFLRITVQEQRQAIDNDLTASALASAEAGIEDAKRAILSYTKMPAGPLRTQYSQALRSPLCNALFGPIYPLVRSDLGLNPNGQVSGQSALSQSYTCLTVSMDTDDYINRMDAGKSDYIPLRADGPYSSVVVSWHLTDTTGDRQPAAYATGGSALFPATGANSWTSRGYPSYLRVQVFGYPGGSFNLDQLEALSHTAYLMPTNFAAGYDETNAYNIELGDSRTGDRAKSAPVSVRCKGTPPNVTAQYACSVKLAFNGVIPVNQNMFMRVTPIYGPTNFKIELDHAGSNPKLVEVQPIVDSTGRAGDVFRRVQARVRLDSSPLLPEFTLETAQDLCKDFIITDNPADFVDNCDPAAAPAAPVGAALFEGCGAACFAGPPLPPPVLSYSRRFTNKTPPPPSPIVGCSWSWGDGSPAGTTACNNGEQIDHVYPSIAPVACRTYTVTLRVNLANGSTLSHSQTTTVPHGSAAPPC